MAPRLTTFRVGRYPRRLPHSPQSIMVGSSVRTRVSNDVPRIRSFINRMVGDTRTAERLFGEREYLSGYIGSAYSHQQISYDERAQLLAYLNQHVSNRMKQVMGI